MQTRFTQLLSASVNAVVLMVIANIVPALDLNAQELFMRGDSNGDQTVDIADATFSLNTLFVAGSEDTRCLDASDSNDDGNFDISDAVFVLLYLFGGGPPPPAPGPDIFCGGADPTNDGLNCQDDLSNQQQPTVEMIAAIAPAPGVRQRSRSLLPETSPGVFEVEVGTSFVLLVISESFPDFLSPARFNFADPEDANRGNPDTLRVTCDRDLGNPSLGGVAAGENLAQYFLNDLDVWNNFLYLTDQAPLRIAGDGPLAPAVGLYEFNIQVVDEECGFSELATMTLDVFASNAPDVFLSVEAAGGTETPLQHDEGSGNPRFTPDDGFVVVVDALPNGANPSQTDPVNLLVLTDPPIGGLTDITNRFVEGTSGHFSASFDPIVDGLTPGNYDFTVSVGSTRDLEIPIELSVSYVNEIQPILDMGCGGGNCHEEPAVAAGLELRRPLTPPLEIWKNFVNIRATQPSISSPVNIRVRPYRPELSYFWHKIAGTHLQVGGMGLRMPRLGAPLDDATMRLFRSWIIQGAGSE